MSVCTIIDGDRHSINFMFTLYRYLYSFSDHLKAIVNQPLKKNLQTSCYCAAYEVVLDACCGAWLSSDHGSTINNWTVNFAVSYCWWTKPCYTSISGISRLAATYWCKRSVHIPCSSWENSMMVYRITESLCFCRDNRKWLFLENYMEYFTVFLASCCFLQCYLCLASEQNIV